MCFKDLFLERGSMTRFYRDFWRLPSGKCVRHVAFQLSREQNPCRSVTTGTIPTLDNICADFWCPGPIVRQEFVICRNSSICVIMLPHAPPSRLSWCASGHTLIYKLRLLLSLQIRCSCTRTVNIHGMLHAPSHGFWHPSSHKGWRRDVENQLGSLGWHIWLFLIAFP